MDAAERLATDKALERLDPECELAGGERALGAEAAPAEALEVLRFCVLGSVDDAEVFAPALTTPPASSTPTAATAGRCGRVGVIGIVISSVDFLVVSRAWLALTR